jgi:hypothetical protein
MHVITRYNDPGTYTNHLNIISKWNAQQIQQNLHFENDYDFDTSLRERVNNKRPFWLRAKAFLRDTLSSLPFITNQEYAKPYIEVVVERCTAWEYFRDHNIDNRLLDFLVVDPDREYLVLSHYTIDNIKRENEPRYEWIMRLAVTVHYVEPSLPINEPVPEMSLHHLFQNLNLQQE